MKHFEKEILSFVRNNNSDVCQFILNDWKQNHSGTSFNNYFQEVFLYKTGAISINTIPIVNTNNGWAPYITFTNDNLYHEESGTKLLTQAPLTQKKAELRIAKYFIEVLNFMLLDKIKYCLKN
ncbi:hypothetical protein MC378_10345 [Polaribacter sp. MSW13]|uniref:Uncharacterized protein n=1 Tax=Polaribacter marinus TaxID=2916838 RepID=A0A9X1VRC3_9FLAO|nr:hypothetical protein [Polaribacter marinus]MCI2229567.1 hypothetical protein [Polaribacter marinus]